MIDFRIRGDGIVHLRLCPPHAETDEAQYFEALERIGVLDQPYTMVIDISGHSHLSRAGEIRQAAWAKATRQQISKTCRGVAMVRENPNPRSQQSFERLWNIPVHVTRDAGEALDFAMAHLKKEKPQA